MAHKRLSKTTSFGKKSEAEKSFRKKKTSRRDETSSEDRPKKSFGKFSKPTLRSADSDKPREKRAYGKKEDSAGENKFTPFRREDFKKRDASKSGGPSKDFKKTRSDEGAEKRFGDKKSEPRFDKREKSSIRRSKSSPSFSSRKEVPFKKTFGDKKSEPRFDKDERPSINRSKSSPSFSSRKEAPFKKRSVPGSVAPKKDDGLTRLNKYIANSGLGSRRDADEIIKLGLISVNGVTITEMGHKVKQGDVVRHEDRILKAEKPVYVLLNKPKGFITTTVDPKDRKTVMNLVAKACKERIYPVGRLDRNTTGLLLLTNDGDLAEKLMHPSYNIKKIYKADLDKPLSKNDLIKISEGVRLEEGKAMVDDIAIVSDDKKSIGLELHIGWNRVVRRIFEALEYEVVKLDRVAYAGLDKKDLPRGEWRFLKPEEIVRLKHFK